MTAGVPAGDHAPRWGQDHAVPSDLTRYRPALGHRAARAMPLVAGDRGLTCSEHRHRLFVAALSLGSYANVSFGYDDCAIAGNGRFAPHFGHAKQSTQVLKADIRAETRGAH